MWRLKKPYYNSWAYVENLFTSDECKQIIEIGTKSLEPAKIQGSLSEGIVDSEYRNSDINFLSANSENEWIFRRITDAVNNVNENVFHYDLEYFNKIQFTRYAAPGGNYSKHIDITPSQPRRKLSLTIQLSDPNDYEGGELMLYAEKKGVSAPKDFGFAAAFPSYTLHEVKPVTKGTRYSLVVWVEGPPFR